MKDTLPDAAFVLVPGDFLAYGFRRAFDAAASNHSDAAYRMFVHKPGIDGYATFRQEACPATIIPMWDQVYADPFYALLQRDADTLVASFAGQTRMDDFRLIGDSSGRYAFTLITPAVSPIFGQNPAFRTVLYDTAGGILDQTTHDLTNLPEATTTGSVPAAQQSEYIFTQEWRLRRFDLPSLDRFYSRTEDVSEERKRWHALFPVSSPVYWSLVADPGEHEGQLVRAYRCASGYVHLPDYRQCYCGGIGRVLRNYVADTPNRQRRFALEATAGAAKPDGTSAEIAQRQETLGV